MKAIPTGTFLMGSPSSELGRGEDEDDVSGPGGEQVTVEISVRFAVSETEITKAQYLSCVRDGVCVENSNHRWIFDTSPIRVTWNEATTYTYWLSQKTSKNYRLLSEAEWEYITRAGSDSSYWTGDDITRAQASFAKKKAMTLVEMVNQGQTGADQTGTFPANAFGIYETAGNVWEWVQDCYGDYLRPEVSQGRAWSEPRCENKVIRGGSFSSGKMDLRSSNRAYFPRNRYSREIGFRVAVETQDLP